MPEAAAGRRVSSESPESRRAESRKIRPCAEKFAFCLHLCGRIPVLSMATTTHFSPIKSKYDDWETKGN